MIANMLNTERKPLVHVCSGGLGHMLRLLSNSIDYALKSNRYLIPHSKNNPAFRLLFFDIFDRLPLDDLFKSVDSFPIYNTRQEATSEQPFLIKDLSDIRLGWNGKPDYSSSKPNTSFYKLIVNNTAFDDYQLCLGGIPDNHFCQITTGEFFDRMGYTISYSFLNHLTLSRYVKDFIRDKTCQVKGEYLGIHLRYSSDKRSDISPLIDSVRSAANSSGISKLFIATDSAEGLDIIRGALPNFDFLTISPIINLDSLGFKNLHGISDDDLLSHIGISKVDQIAYAFADLFALASSKILITCNSEFSRLAAKLHSIDFVSQRASFFGTD